MYKLIPAHSLVIVVGASTINREGTVNRYFDEFEIVSARRISSDLVGEPDRPDLNSVVYGEVRHRVSLKLELGERVVVDAANLRREDRMSLARLATDNGIPVFYLITDPAGADDKSVQRLKAGERELLRGDGVAEVIDWRFHEPQPVVKAKPDHDALANGWNGITVIGDIHGMHQSLLAALSWARARRHYVIFLGDIIDYGPGTLEVADEVYKVVMRGEGELILGNHERKIARWVSQADKGRHGVRLSDGNKVTTDALLALGSQARAKWEGRFRGLVARGSHCRRIGNITFAHASVHPGFWTGEASPKDIETWALFGEFDQADPDGSRPARRYSWVEHVPATETVIVGHDIRSTQKPLQTRNSAGGTAVFLDTGSGKGGLLSSADLKFAPSGLRIENFNMY